MHVIQHNSNTSKSFQIMISTELENIYFGNSTNNNNITFILETSKNISDVSHAFLVSLSHLEIPISWPLISSYYGNNQLVYILNNVTYRLCVKSFGKNIFYYFVIEKIFSIFFFCANDVD